MESVAGKENTVLHPATVKTADPRISAAPFTHSRTPRVDVEIREDYRRGASRAAAWGPALTVPIMNMVSTITEQANAALKARDLTRLSALRMLRAALKNAAIDVHHELSDDEAVAVIASEVKKLRDSLEQFRAGGRQDLVTKTEAEIALLAAYLPAQAPAEEIRAVVRRVAAGADPTDYGKVMGAAMKELKGKADGAAVGVIVKELLGSP